MDLGIFNLMQQRGADVTSSELVDDAIRHTRIAESLGFGRAWFAEHHFSSYSLCPSPLMMVAHAAAMTERIRLGTAVIVAPLHTPARLLGEIGLADSLSGGRLDLGARQRLPALRVRTLRVSTSRSAGGGCSRCST